MDRPPADQDAERERSGLGRYFRRFGNVWRRGSPARESGATTAAQSPTNNPTNTSAARLTAAPPQRILPPPRSRSVGEQGKGSSVRASEATAGGRDADDDPTGTTTTRQVLSGSPSGPNVLVPSRQGPADEQAVAEVLPYARTPSSYEKIKAMFAKYNIPIDESTMPPKLVKQGVRVEKPIRMRVRITCHLCETSYSSSKTCPNCQHQRCRECRRWPERKKNRKGKGKEKVGDRDLSGGGEGVVASRGLHPRNIATDRDLSSADETEDQVDRTNPGLRTVPKRPKRKKEVVFSMPSRRGGQEVMRKLPRQRVHRSCCKCRRSFIHPSKECLTCRHLRCTQCPRDPAKLDRWPDGYPGDIIPANPGVGSREWKKARVRVRWTCHVCRRMFREGESNCTGCTHARCSECHRDPPKRVPQPLNEAAVQSVQQKLAAVGSSSNQPPDPAGTSATLASAPGPPCTSTEFVPTMESSA